MSARPKKPTKVEINLREPEQIAPIEEKHVPLVAADEMKVPQRVIDLCDRAIAADGKTVEAEDSCTAWRCDPPKEAGLVDLPKSQLLYVNVGDIRPALRWLPAFILQKAQLNGWDYLSAKRLYVEPSVPIYAALEQLFGR